MSNNNLSPRIFDLIHVDVWGPFHTITVDVFKYFLTIVDDKSRFTWIYLLHAKSDVQRIIPQFYAMILNQFGITIKGVRSDNAKELSLIDFYLSKGVIHFHCCIKRPDELNSVVKRKHQHLLNVDCAFVFQSNVSLVYWNDFFMTDAHLINIMPSSLLQSKSPFEFLYNKVPSYSHLRSFGCLCYAFTFISTRDKFPPQFRARVFFGYPLGMKAYKIFDIRSNYVFYSRDDKFGDGVFPLSNTSSTSDGLDLFSNKVLPFPSFEQSIYVPNISPVLALALVNVESLASPDIVSSVPQTRSHRVITRLSYLQNYHCGLISSEFPSSSKTVHYPLSKVLSYDHLHEDFKAVVMSVSIYFEPQSFTQAIGMHE